jgi:hypothetical protein
VDFPTVLLRDLLQFSSHVELDDDALGAPLASLVADLQVAVPSYRGLHLTMVDSGYPVSLTAFLPLHDGDSITTSLRIGLAALGPGFDDSSVVFYATTPGAFVDLAADIGYALPSLHRDGHRLIALDADLPPPAAISGLVGLDELSTINRAVGILIDHGHHPHQANAALRRDAAAAGLEPHIYAARLLLRSRSGALVH